MKTKKAISPVVAVALLLVTTVIAAVGFQTWFNEFSTELFTDTETKGDADGLTSRVETIVDGNLYIYSGFTNNVSYSNLQVAGKTCNISGQLANGVNTVDITSCSAISSGVNEVVVITEKGVISEEVYVSTSGTSSLSVTCTNTSAPFHGGAGTEGDPYEICNCSQLVNLSTSASSHFELVQDINCNVAPLNTGEGFVPIYGPFTGSLEGNNYVVSGLYINRSNSNAEGLFGYFEGNVSNLGITNVNITGGNQSGALVGYSQQNGILDNVYATGSVSGDRQIGGLVGLGRQIVINNSYSTVTVNASGDSVGGIAGQIFTATNYIQNTYYSGTVTSENQRVGGLVGSLTSGLIHNSYSTGSITGLNQTGGLAGYVSSSEVNDSYSTATVQGAQYVGGLIGYGSGVSSENAYASGSVNGSTNVGGFAGRYSSSSLNSSFSTGDVTGGSNSGGFTGINTGGSTFVTVYWNNHSGNPSNTGGASGVNVIQNDLSHFYGSANAPHGNWSATDWSFSGSALPTLN